LTMKYLLLLLVCLIAQSQGQKLTGTCEDFKVDACCPLGEMSIISRNDEVGTPAECQQLCKETSVENDGECVFFTHYETSCYLLRSCDHVDPTEGCLSGPTEPAYDSCFGTTVVTDTTPEMTTEMTTEAMTTGFTTDEVTTGLSTTEAVVTTGAPTTCDDFEEGVCPLDEENILAQEEASTPDECQYLCIKSALTGGGCKYFTQFETTCYLLKTCESVAHVPGCVSGPNLPDYDSCVEATTAGPETTTAGPETTTAGEGTTTMPATTDSPSDCSGFHPGFLCEPHENIIDTITHIMTPKECQTLCQLRSGCTYWSHWIEVVDMHIGHCDLHWACPYLVEDKCLNEADPKCPIIPSSIYGDTDDDVNDAREELDAALEKDMPPGPGSGECGCIAGPVYPDIDQCDFW